MGYNAEYQEKGLEGKAMHLKATAAVLVLLPITGEGMDIEPFKIGQVVDAQQAHQLQQRLNDRKQQPWCKPADMTSIDVQPDADSIRYGIQLLNKTALTIGPNVTDKAKRYSGNDLNCSSCHLKGASGLPGTKYLGIPFTNVVNDYPNFRARSMSVGSIQDRVNGCMTRSMGDGKPLLVDSKEMKGIVAYFRWLATGTNSNEAMQGMGLPVVKMPNRTVNIKNGEILFSKYCIVCHGTGGLGQKAPEPKKTGPYLFPPIAGDDSFNDGAGMSRTMTATRFIYGNMPFGTDAVNPTLTVEQAYNLAGYMLSLQRPRKKDRAKDFPDPEFRPTDYAVPEYFGSDKTAYDKAKNGPYIK